MKCLFFTILFSCFLFGNNLELSGNPFSSGKEDVNYLFIPDFDSDDKVKFFIVNKPKWAVFNYETGELSDKPKIGDEGLYKDIVISITDSNDTIHLEPFIIDVVSINEKSYTLYKIIGLTLSFLLVLFVI